MSTDYLHGCKASQREADDMRLAIVGVVSDKMCDRVRAKFQRPWTKFFRFRVLRKIWNYKMIIAKEWYDVLPFEVAGEEAVD
jgi:hypothetical protein